MELMVQRVRRGLKGIQEIPVQRELMVRMVRLEPRVHKDLKVKLVRKVQRVRRDLKGIQEIRVQRELQELLEHKEPQA
jgi:hypothetical protein